MNPIESLQVDGVPRALSAFMVPEMSLSSATASLIRHSFEIKIHTSALVDFLEPAYAAWAADAKEDDKQCGAPQDELAEAGYPTLAQVIETPSLLKLVVGSYLLRDLLGKLTWDGTSSVEYWLDSVTHCHLHNGTVLLSGICYSQAEA